MKHRSVIYYLVAPLSALFSTIFAMSLQPIIDYGLDRQMERFLWAVIAAVVFCLLDILFSFLTEYYMMATKTDRVRSFRVRCMDLILQGGYEEYAKKASTYYTSLLTVNAEQIGQKYYESGMRIYRYLFSLAVSIVAIGYAGWEILLYVVVFSLISVYLPKLFQRQSIAAERKYANQSEAHISFVQETFQNFVPIRVFRLLGKRCRTYRMKCEELADADRKRNRKTFLLDSVAAGIGELSYVMIIIFAMILVIRGRLTVGYIMSVSQILGGIMFPFEILPGCILERRSGKVLKDTLESECRDLAGRKLPAGRLKQEPQFLECRHASFGYEGKEILHDLSFRFDLSKKYAIIGKSGSGKSTLAKGLCGFLTPMSGECVIDGIKVNDISYDELFKYLIYQEQGEALFDGTLMDNIDLTGKRSKEKLCQIRKSVRLDEMFDRQPEGQQRFSGGEVQRILLARAFSTDAKLMVLDECLSALDNENARQIEANILRQKEKGVIMITHRIYEKNMRMYDCVLVMENGRLIEYGSWDELQLKTPFFTGKSCE